MGGLCFSGKLSIALGEVWGYNHATFHLIIGFLEAMDVSAGFNNTVHVLSKRFAKVKVSLIRIIVRTAFVADCSDR